MSQHTVVKNKTVAAKPFVKWAGGKGNLLQKLEALLPADFDDHENITYIEPFVGGGAMLFHMLQTHRNIRRAVINDINPDLIRCYELIVKTPQVLIEQLKAIEQEFYSLPFESRNAMYYSYREKYNLEVLHPDEQAALFIFLNHTCYNGLYRVNRAGKFNVPYGRYKKPVICNEKLLMADHHLLSSVELIIRQPGDYKLVQQNLSKSHINFLYFDPPYRPLSNTSYFKEYSNSPFNDEQQIELKQFCDRLWNRDYLLMLSNSDSHNADGTSFFDNLYAGYDIQRILAPRFINANPEKRKNQTEVVIRNY